MRAARSGACPVLFHRPNSLCSGEQGMGLPVPFPCAQLRVSPNQGGHRGKKEKNVFLQTSCGDAPSSSAVALAPHFLSTSGQSAPSAPCSSLGHTHCRDPVTRHVCCVPGWVLLLPGVLPCCCDGCGKQVMGPQCPE